MNTKPPPLEERTTTIVTALEQLDNIVAQQAIQVIQDLIRAGGRIQAKADTANRELADANTKVATLENNVHNLGKRITAFWNLPQAEKDRAQLKGLLMRLDDILAVDHLKEHEQIEAMLDLLEKR
jgi:outer membrane murein-binding lipoprotein Lpp